MSGPRLSRGIASSTPIERERPSRGKPLSSVLIRLTSCIEWLWSAPVGETA